MHNLKNTLNLLNKRIIALNIRFLILVGFLISQKSYSQQLSGNAGDKDLRNFNEEVFVRTDRDTYISGEQVWFKVYTLNGLTGTPCSISKVVYLELLDKNNFPLKQLKVKTENGSGSSAFVLPDNISSGNYLIRAYTNWKKNFSSDQFFYKAISVINPFESIDHLKLPPAIAHSDSATGNHSNFNITDKEGREIYGQPVPDREKRKSINYTITLDKSWYSSREKVKMKIAATDLSGKPVEADLSVAVAKSSIVSSTGATSFYCFNRNQSSDSRIDSAVYLAELEGQIISGYLRDKGTDEPLKNTEITLAYVGKTARCHFTKTDGRGEFNFVVNESGLNEIVIQTLSHDISDYYVELNQPFSNAFSEYKPVPFYLDSSKIDAINKVIIGMQVNNIYQPFRQTKTEELKPADPDFYGKPENTIKMDDYIELTSLREVVKEIIPNVYTLKQNGKYDFKLINKFRGQPFENKPLILVDGVPVYDFEKVLSINSKEIERADIINTRYFFSENIFDGIVSFVTRKGNLSVMEYDRSVFRQVYEGCQVKETFYSPDFSAPVNDRRIPDFRNTLFWKPDVHTGKDGSAEVVFYTSDESSDYSIVVEGITTDGKTGFSSAGLNVK
jgi:hypothetical protein